MSDRMSDRYLSDRHTDRSLSRHQDDDYVSSAPGTGRQMRSAESQREILIARLEDKIRESEDLYQSLEDRILDRERELDVCRSDLQACEDDLVAAREDVQRWQRSADGCRDEAQQLRRDLDARRAEIDELQRALWQRDRDYDAVCKESRQEAIHRETAVDDRARELESVRQQFKEAERTIALMKEVIDEKNQSIDLLRAQHDVDLDTQGGLFNSVLDERNTDMQGMRGEVEALRKERDAERLKVQEMEEHFQSAEDRMTDLEYANGQLQQQLDAAADRHSTERVRLEEEHQRRYDDRVGEQRTQLEALRESLDTARVQSQRREEENRVLRDELEDLGADRDRLAEELEHVQRHAGKLRGQLDKESTAADTASTRLDEQAEEVHELRHRLQDISRDREEMEMVLRELEAARNALQDERDVALRDVAELNDQAQRDKQALDELELEREQLLQRAAAASQSDGGGSAADVSALEREREELRADLEAMKQSDTTLREELQELTADRDALKDALAQRAAVGGGDEHEEMETLLSDHRALAAELEQVKAQLADAGAAGDGGRDVAAMPETWQAQLDEARQALDESRQALSEGLDREADAQEEISRLRDRLQCSEAAANSDTTDAEELQRVIDDLTAQLAAAKKDGGGETNSQVQDLTVKLEAAEDAKREAESDLEYLEEVLQRLKVLQRETCNSITLPVIPLAKPDGLDKSPVELMADIRNAVLQITQELEELDTSRSRSRRQKDEIISLLLEDPALDELSWPDDDSSEDDLSDHRSGGPRWVKARGRVRRLADRFPQLERRKDELKKKLRSERARVEELDERLRYTEDILDKAQMTGPSQTRHHDAYADYEDQQVQEMDSKYGRRASPTLTGLGLMLEARRSAYDREKGVLVTDVSRDSPAYQAQIVAGDRVVEFDSHRVEAAAEVKSLLKEFIHGDTVPVKILRNKRVMTVTVVIDCSAHQSQAPAPRRKSVGRRSRDGAVTPPTRRGNTGAASKVRSAKR
eukprot:TRINITY_DN477_c2_g2_i1.p1 TRINITY_DN477_c2_g2~~TRINITY_DN477_c2_g2_i1.p1  ORF type:complete len:997 (+),score=286.79 TRINITY_DN477_c2_g2_i1:165-3155(+)